MLHRHYGLSFMAVLAATCGPLQRVLLKHARIRKLGDNGGSLAVTNGARHSALERWWS